MDILRIFFRLLTAKFVDGSYEDQLLGKTSWKDLKDKFNFEKESLKGKESSNEILNIFVNILK